MTQPRKFLFDNSFDAPSHPKRLEETAAPVPEPPPGYSEEELQAARELARREGEEAGRAAGLEEAAASREQAMLGLAQRLSADLGQLFHDAEERAHDAERQALETARAVLQRLFPALAAREGPEEILVLLRESLGLARAEPRVVVRVADENLDGLREQLDALREVAGFEGRVVLLADAELGASDIRVEWADGGIERHAERIWQEIDAILQRGLGAARHPDQPNKELSNASE